MWTPLLRTPVWVRATVAGFIYGAAMFAWGQLRSEKVPLVVSAVIWVVGGAVFGLVMGWIMRRRERRMAQAGAGTLDGDQRVAAYRAMKDGRLPDDPQARDAAVHLAKTQFQGANSPAFVVVLVLVLGSLAAWLAIDGQPLWWLAVGFWIVAGAGMLYAQRRARKLAGHILAAAGERSPNGSEDVQAAR